MKFLVIWGILLAIFTSVGMIAFGGLPRFHYVFETFTLFFESALGEFDTSVFREENEFGEKNESIATAGFTYQCIFLLFNLILMLNLVVTFLSHTFGKYESF